MDTAAPAAPASPPPAPPAPETPGLAAEVRESVLLLSLALGVTVGLTAVAQAALSALS